MFPHRSKPLVAFLVAFSTAAVTSGQDRQEESPAVGPAPRAAQAPSDAKSDAGGTREDSGGKAADSSSTAVSLEIAAGLKEIKGQERLDADLKTKIVEAYKQAQSALDEAEESKHRAMRYTISIESAPKETREILDRLEQAKAKAPPEVPVPLPHSTADLAVEVTKVKAEIAIAKTDLDRQASAIETQQGRPEKNRAERKAATERLADLEEQLKVPLPPEAANKPFLKASRTSLKARRLARKDELAMLDREFLTHTARLKLLEAQQQAAQHASSLNEARLKVLEDALSERLGNEVRDLVDQVERDIAEDQGKHPVITQVTDENRQLIKELLDDSLEAAAVRPAKDRAAATTRQLTDVYTRTRAQIEVVGVGGVGGKVLRERRKQLPDILRDNQVVAARWSGKIAAAEARRFEIGIGQNDLGSLDIAVDRRLKSTEQPVPENERAAISADVKQHLANQVKLLQKLGDTYTPYIDALRELETTQRELDKTARDFAGLLDQWLLWIPSSQIPNLKTLRELGRSIQWIVSPVRWGDAGRVLLADLQARPALAGFTLLLCAGLCMVRPRMYRKYAELADRVGSIKRDSMTHTLLALVLSLLVVAPIPIAAAYVGWRLTAGASTSTFAFTGALGTGLLSVAGLFFTMRFFAAICGPRGVAEVHFRWRETTIGLVRRHLAWLMWVLPPTFFFVSLTDAQPDENIQNSLGRLAFVIGMGTLGVFIQRVVRPDGALMATLLAKSPSGWASRLRFLWYPLAVGVPLALVAIAAAGYYYTALALQDRLAASVGLIIGAILLEQLGERWLLVAARRLAIEKAREARKTKEEAAKAAGQTQDGASAEDLVLDVPDVDISTVNDQTRRLLGTVVDLSVLFALWGIWAGVLPALGILDEVELWQSTVVDESGASILEWITLQHLVLSIIALAITIVAAKNLPGALEIAVLKNLPLEAGMRYALSTVSQYVVTVVGVIIAFSVIGIGWAQVQFLVAAVSFGIGFGLQEIIANFFCGLILLFERPIRVGDIVTVGDVTGTVSRIRIRATTITNWDRMEYVVPNKELITGRLLNWTLSNSINRVLIRVGISYDSDPVKGRDLLLKVAKDHPLIMEDPAPVATFDGFGDSTLNLILRCYLPDFANRLGTINELHASINEAFKAAGIEIAFPQMDLHLRSGDIKELTRGDAGDH